MADGFCLQREPRMTVTDVLIDIFTRPQDLVRRWHWKAAVFSSVLRGGMFFGTNISAGWEAATGAGLAEFLYRLVASGFYGSMTQSFRKARPEWLANLTAAIVLPAIQHTIEFGIHWMRGTPNLKLSIGTSIGFTIYSTLFNLYSMRRGALLVGQDAQPIWHDIVRFPALFVGFVASAATGCGRLLQSAFRR